MSDEKNGFLGVVFTFLTGAALGAGLALLYAPQSGEETRKQIKDGYDKLSDDVKEKSEKFAKEAQSAVDNVKQTSEKAVAQIKTFMDSVKDTIVKEAEKTPKEPTKVEKKKAAKA